MGEGFCQLTETAGGMARDERVREAPVGEFAVGKREEKCGCGGRVALSFALQSGLRGLSNTRKCSDVV